MMKIFLYIVISISVLYANTEQAQKNPYIKSDNIIADTINMLKGSSPVSEYQLGVQYAAQFVKDKMYASSHKRVVYLNNIMNNLTLSSDKPYVYNGYKLILVHNSSFNAYALPGGIIIINDGVFKHLKNEDQIAAILAHEIGHIQEKHNINTADTKTLTNLGKIGALYAVGKNVDNGMLQMVSLSLTSSFTDKVENGYDVDMEAEADALGVKIMTKAGYDPQEFINVLNILKDTTNSYGGANYPEDRVERIKELIVDNSIDQKAKVDRTKRYTSIR